MIILRGILLTNIPYKPGSSVLMRMDDGSDANLQLTRAQAEQVSVLLEGRVSVCGEWLDPDKPSYVPPFRVVSIVREP